MKSGPTVLIVGSVTLGLTAVLFAMAIRHHEPQQLTYAAGTPEAQAELERLLKKHGVLFSHKSGAQSPVKAENMTVVLNVHGVVIEDAGAPNAVAAMQEFSSWSESQPETNDSVASN